MGYIRLGMKKMYQLKISLAIKVIKAYKYKSNG